jgi:tetratricopeptide (TPR) repeat protein
MSTDVVTRYREALRRGHVAAAGGDLPAAVAAYEEAAGLAPDRAVAAASMGLVQLKLGSPADALAAFDAALARAARDEVALRGRADALARLGRRTDAAETLDVLSEGQERAGRLADATETAELALNLAEQKTRRRRLRDLTRRIRSSTADHQASGALDKALRILERDDASAEADRASIAGAEAAAARADAELAAELLAQVVPEPAPDGAVLLADAERALDAGDEARARDELLGAARAFRAAGLASAAIDACYLALAFVPDDPELHLALVDLYLERGWDTPAADKLVLLARLTDLDGAAPGIRARIVGLAADHFPDDPRLRRLSA